MICISSNRRTVYAKYCGYSAFICMAERGTSTIFCLWSRPETNSSKIIPTSCKRKKGWMKVKHNGKAPSFVKLPPPFSLSVVNYIFREVPLSLWSAVFWSCTSEHPGLLYFSYQFLFKELYTNVFYTHTNTPWFRKIAGQIVIWWRNKNRSMANKSLQSCLTLCDSTWTVPCQASLSMGFFRQEYWNRLPCPPSRDLRDPGIEPTSLLLHWQADSLALGPPGKANGKESCALILC